IDLACHGTPLAALDLDFFFSRDNHAEYALFQVHRDDARLNMSTHFVLVAGIGVDGVPVPPFLERLCMRGDRRRVLIVLHAVSLFAYARLLYEIISAPRPVCSACVWRD